MKARGGIRPRGDPSVGGGAAGRGRGRAAPGHAVLLLALLLFGLVGAPAGHAENAPEVVAGVVRDWPPEYSLNDEGEPTGYAVDVMNAVAQRAGLRVRYRIYETFPEALNALANGQVEVIPNMGITPKRLETFAYTTPVETFALAFFVRSDAVGIRTPADLSGRRVAVVQSNAALSLLASRDLILEVHPSVSRALFDLLSGRIDAVAYPSSVLRSLAREVGVRDRIRELKPPVAEIKRAIALRRDEPALLARLDTAVNGFLASPEYRKIYVRWYGREPRFWNTRRVLFLVASLLSALIVAAAFWRYRMLARHNRELQARIGERDVAEAALAASEVNYRRIVETTSEGVWLVDEHATTTFVNGRMAAMLGYAPADMVGRSMYEFFDDALAEEARQNMERRRRGLSERHDFTLRRVDGSELLASMAASPVFENGEFAGALAMVSDTTEKRELEARLIQAQRLEAIGRLAGGVAHDFNNLLLVIGASSELARQALGREHPASRDLEQIQEASRRATDLTSQLLAFSRKQVTFAQIIDPVARLVESRTLLERLLGEDVELGIENRGSGACVSIDPTQFDRLVFNIAGNARDAMPDGGTLTIRVSEETVEPGDDVPAGDYVVLSFEDTGIGMTEEVAQHAFEPFFTTKPWGRGTGLGLATCYGIARQAGGTISALALSKGARFVVHLPSKPCSLPSEAPKATRSSARGRFQRVLLVEDEPGARRIMKRVLERAGLEVAAMASPEEALGFLQESDRRIDVLVTDVIMPGMKGPELGRRARELHPTLRVLYISGYTDRHFDSLEELDEHQGFLAKPFAPDALIAAIAALD